MKPPTYHELSIPVLNKKVVYTNELLSNHKKSWGKHGSSFMSNGWTGRTNQSLINILVNYSTGTMSVKSIDASCILKTKEKRLNYFIICQSNWGG